MFYGTTVNVILFIPIILAFHYSQNSFKKEAIKQGKIAFAMGVIFSFWGGLYHLGYFIALVRESDFLFFKYDILYPNIRRGIMANFTILSWGIVTYVLATTEICKYFKKRTLFVLNLMAIVLIVVMAFVDLSIKPNNPKSSGGSGCLLGIVFLIYSGVGFSKITEGQSK